MADDAMFSNPVKLAFDPRELTGQLRTIFDDPLSRTIWLSWRSRHIVNQHFNDEVVEIAKALTKKPPTSCDDVKRLLLRFRGWPGSNFGCISGPAWAEQVFPFITGGDELRYEVDA